MYFSVTRWDCLQLRDDCLLSWFIAKVFPVFNELKWSTLRTAIRSPWLLKGTITWLRYWICTMSTTEQHFFIGKYSNQNPLEWTYSPQLVSWSSDCWTIRWDYEWCSLYRACCFYCRKVKLMAIIPAEAGKGLLWMWKASRFRRVTSRVLRPEDFSRRQVRHLNHWREDS